MTRFLDGPAEGVTLDLRRSPLLLRVVVSRKGTWDALDQPDDEPAAGESIHVYYRVTEPFTGFMDYRAGPKGGRRAGHRFSSADYRVLPAEDQPRDEIARDRDSWQGWAMSRCMEWGWISEDGEP